MSLKWMVWTTPTAIFFGVITAILIAMTLWQAVAPSPERRGFLPIPTTPGDRLFIGLVVTGFVHLAWMGFFNGGLWIAFAICVIWMVIVMRWG